jgi:hypothetical protein
MAMIRLDSVNANDRSSKLVARGSQRRSTWMEYMETRVLRGEAQVHAAPTRA